MNTHRPTRDTARINGPDPAERAACRPGEAISTAADPLTVLAQSMESLRPDGAPPAWAEIIGPLTRPGHARWHGDLDTMMGFVAPAECAAIVTVGYGWARNLLEVPPNSEPVLGPGERRRCRVVFLLTRSGDVAGYLRSGPAILIGDAPTVGRIPDLVRRCLGLPTPPPEESTAGLLAVMWLAHIAGAGARSAERLTWQAVAGLHPALQVAAEAGIAVQPEQAASALRVAADVWSWSHLARQAAEPGWLADLLPAGAAGWMDEGILSRWLLDSLPSIASLLAQVTPLLTAVTAMKLRVTLGQLGVATRLHRGRPSPERPAGTPTGVAGPHRRDRFERLCCMSTRRAPQGTVYLLCFGDHPYHHAKHYLGFTTDLDARLAAHAAGRGARLLEVITAAGIGFTLARTWEGTRSLERKLKNQHNSCRLCPICRADRQAARPPR